MNKLRQRFQTLFKKYQDRRDHYKKVIERWKTRGWLDSYKKGSTLIDEADTLCTKLEHSFSPEAQASAE